MFFHVTFDEKIEEKIALFFFHLRTFSGWELVLPVDNTVVKQTFFKAVDDNFSRV